MDVKSIARILTLLSVLGASWGVVPNHACAAAGTPTCAPVAVKAAHACCDQQAVSHSVERSRLPASPCGRMLCCLPRAPERVALAVELTAPDLTFALWSTSLLPDWRPSLVRRISLTASPPGLSPGFFSQRPARGPPYTA